MSSGIIEISSSVLSEPSLASEYLKGVAGHGHSSPPEQISREKGPIRAISSLLHFSGSFLQSILLIRKAFGEL